MSIEVIPEWRNYVRQASIGQATVGAANQIRHELQVAVGGDVGASENIVVEHHSEGKRDVCSTVTTTGACVVGARDDSRGRRNEGVVGGRSAGRGCRGAGARERGRNRGRGCNGGGAWGRVVLHQRLVWAVVVPHSPHVVGRHHCY